MTKQGKYRINARKQKDRKFQRSPKRKPAPAAKRPMQPGSDKSLKPVFQTIGIPTKKPFTPDPFQLKAVNAIEKSDCLVTAPTGAGKTWIAMEAVKKVMQTGGNTWYATPLKALTNSIHQQFAREFKQENVGILTGDIKERPDAPIIIGTTEILRNQLYDAMHKGFSLEQDLIILDEAHFLGDRERGVVWEEIMIYLPVSIPILLLSATIGNPSIIAGWLEKIRGKPCKVVTAHERPVPLFPLFLHPSGTLFPLLEKQESKTNVRKKQLLHKKVLKFDNRKQNRFSRSHGRIPPFADILSIFHHYNLLPAIFFLKSRKECDIALKHCNADLLSRNPKKKTTLKNNMQQLVSGSKHLAGHSQRRQIEMTGCTSHHSGHLPAWKVVVETLMAKGDLYAMFATSTVAAGVNFPARSVVVINSDRFNGVDFMPLTTSEFQQMTGRAGRRGMDNIGFAIMMPGRYMDLKYVAHLIHSPPMDIESQISINFSMVLNLLLSHEPEQVKTLLEKSFASHLIHMGRKKGKKARKKFGTDLQLLWMDFLDHLDFLIVHGFVTEAGQLTHDGMWATNLRVDAPLLIAESLRKNLLPESDPVLLASIVAGFVNEKEFKDDILYTKALPKALKETFLHLRKELKPFAVDMLTHGFDAPNLFIQPGLLVYAWALGEPWETLVTSSDYGPGDFARLNLRTADNLRQISKLKETFPEIAGTAQKAIPLLLKEPIVTEEHL